MHSRGFGVIFTKDIPNTCISHPILIEKTAGQYILLIKNGLDVYLRLNFLMRRCSHFFGNVGTNTCNHVLITRIWAPPTVPKKSDSTSLSTVIELFLESDYGRLHDSGHGSRSWSDDSDLGLMNRRRYPWHWQSHAVQQHDPLAKSTYGSYAQIWAPVRCLEFWRKNLVFKYKCTGDITQCGQLAQLDCISFLFITFWSWCGGLWFEPRVISLFLHAVMVRSWPSRLATKLYICPFEPLVLFTLLNHERIMLNIISRRYSAETICWVTVFNWDHPARAHGCDNHFMFDSAQFAPVCRHLPAHCGAGHAPNHCLMAKFCPKNPR